eukprot:m.215321 g.215321  ORF g.215321 m.215321 type:complete len:369 (+) comp40710_c0_seq1:25-1131(+)
MDEGTVAETPAGTHAAASPDLLAHHLQDAAVEPVAALPILPENVNVAAAQSSKKKARHECEECGVTFTRLTNLQRHTRNQHDGNFKLRCAVCGLRCEDVHHLKAHVARHPLDVQATPVLLKRVRSDCRALLSELRAARCALAKASNPRCTASACAISSARNSGNTGMSMLWQTHSCVSSAGTRCTGLAPATSLLSLVWTCRSSCARAVWQTISCSRTLVSRPTKMHRRSPTTCATCSASRLSTLPPTATACSPAWRRSWQQRALLAQALWPRLRSSCSGRLSSKRRFCSRCRTRSPTRMWSAHRVCWPFPIPSLHKPCAETGAPPSSTNYRTSCLCTCAGRCIYSPAQTTMSPPRLPSWRATAREASR